MKSASTVEVLLVRLIAEGGVKSGKTHQLMRLAKQITELANDASTSQAGVEITVAVDAIERHQVPR